MPSQDSPNELGIGPERSRRVVYFGSPGSPGSSCFPGSSFGSGTGISPGDVPPGSSSGTISGSSNGGVGRLGTVSGVISGFSGVGTSAGLSGFVFLAIVVGLQLEMQKPFQRP